MPFSQIGLNPKDIEVTVNNVQHPTFDETNNSQSMGIQESGYEGLNMQDISLKEGAKYIPLIDDQCINNQTNNYPISIQIQIRRIKNRTESGYPRSAGIDASANIAVKKRQKRFKGMNNNHVYLGIQSWASI